MWHTFTKERQLNNRMWKDEMTHKAPFQRIAYAWKNISSKGLSPNPSPPPNPLASVHARQIQISTAASASYQQFLLPVQIVQTDLLYQAYVSEFVGKGESG